MSFNTHQNENIIFKIGEIHFLNISNRCCGDYFKRKEEEEKKNRGIRNVLTFSTSMMSGVT